MITNYDLITINYLLKRALKGCKDSKRQLIEYKRVRKIMIKEKTHEALR